jgi:hypothetical protein
VRLIYIPEIAEDAFQDEAYLFGPRFNQPSFLLPIVGHSLFLCCLQLSRIILSFPRDDAGIATLPVLCFSDLGSCKIFNLSTNSGGGIECAPSYAKDYVVLTITPRSGNGHQRVPRGNRPHQMLPMPR